MSKLELGWKVLTGFIIPWESVAGNIADYGLDLLNSAIHKLDPENKAKIQAVLNLAKKVLSVLNTASCLCPTKWQTAYGETVKAVSTVADSLSDLTLTQEECASIAKDFNEAVIAWKSPDDNTCLDCSVSD